MKYVAKGLKIVLLGGWLGLVGCAADGTDDPSAEQQTTPEEQAEGSDNVEGTESALELQNVFKRSQVVHGVTLTCAAVTTTFPTRCIGPRVNGRPIVSNNRWEAAVGVCRAVINAEGRTANTIGDSRLANVIRFVRALARWENAPPDGRIVTDISCHAGLRRSLRGNIPIFNANLTCDDVVETYPIRCIGPKINGLPLIARSRWDLAEVVCNLVIGVHARTSNTIGDSSVPTVYDLDRPLRNFFRTGGSGRIVTDFSCHAPPFP